MTDKLNRQIIQALDQSLEEIDEQSLKALALARQNALAQATLQTEDHNRAGNIFPFTGGPKKYYVPALAAALLLALVIPNIDQYHPSKPLPMAIENYYDVDPEMLETADILILLGELAEEEAGD